MSDTEISPPRASSPPPQSRSLLWRQKWVIVLCLAIGSGVFLLNSRGNTDRNVSEAKLLLKYLVHDEKSGAKASALMNDQMAILYSRDLAMAVSQSIGVAKLLGREGTASEGADKISSNLQVQTQAENGIITLRYSEPDADLCVLVLNEIIEQYRRKHAAIYRPANAFDYVSQRVDQVRMQHHETTQKLTEAKLASNTSGDGNRLNLLETRQSKLKEQMMAEEAALAGLGARMKALRGEDGEISEANRTALVAAETEAVEVKARREVLGSQMEKLERDTAEHLALSVRIEELEQLRGIQEERLRAIENALERARMDEALDRPNKMSRISLIQKPSRPH